MRTALPRGRTLPEAAWRRRHRALLSLLWLHVPIVLVYGLTADVSTPHALAETAPIGAIALAATLASAHRDAAMTLVSLGLLTCSAVLIHLSGGFIELHFHFFVVVVALTLYEDWIPFLVAIVYVALHHGVMGTIDPSGVYNHPEAQQHPWRWALIHAGFIVAAAAAAVTTWRLNEDVREEHVAAEARAREAERAQAAAVVDLERSNADLQQFAYVASHDLQEPLRTVAGFMQLVQQRYRGQLDDDADEFIDFAVGGAKRMQHLIDDLLAWSRVGSVELRRDPVDLGDVASEVLLALHAPIEHAGAEVRVDALPMILGDERQLGQLLQNLVSNGVKFAREDRAPVVRVYSRREPGHWLVSVVDNGVGLDAAQRAKAFKRCSRGCTTATPRRGPGSASRSASGSWSVTAARSGSTTATTGAAPSASRCPVACERGARRRRAERRRVRPRAPHATACVGTGRESDCSVRGKGGGGGAARRLSAGAPQAVISGHFLSVCERK